MMSASIEANRVVLSEVPLKDEGRIFVYYQGQNGGGRKTLNIRSTQRAYDLPEGVFEHEITSLEVVEGNGDGTFDSPSNEAEAATQDAPTPTTEDSLATNDTVNTEVTSADAETVDGLADALPPKEEEKANE